MKHSYFPDINLWLALTAAHTHTKPAIEWYDSLQDGEILYFCRLTQLGLLRLLTTKSVMGANTHSQRGAWQIYEQWRNEGNAGFLIELAGIDALIGARANHLQSSPKSWNDDYLAAFAETAGVTLVTFDKTLAEKTKGAVLLG